MIRKTKVMIIDGDNLLHRAYHKFGGLANSEGISTSAIYGFPYVLRSLLNKFHPDILYIAFDGGRHVGRTSIYPEYKQTKRRMDFDYEDLLRQKKIIIDLAYAFGAIVLYEKGMEADDLIYSLIVKEKLKTHNVILISSDKDFHQLLSKSIKIFNPFSDKLITIKNVEKLFGYTQSQARDYLILNGDKSDNIPGYKGMGPKRINDFFKVYNSINEFLLDSDDYKGLDKKQLKALYKRNKRLMGLRDFYLKFLKHKPLPFLNNINSKHKMLTIHIAKVCNDYDINTFLTQDFLSTYKKICL